MLASYVHLMFASNPVFAAAIVERCRLVRFSERPHDAVSCTLARTHLYFHSHAFVHRFMIDLRHYLHQGTDGEIGVYMVWDDRIYPTLCYSDCVVC